jgi:hypothetical protein
MAIAKHDLKLTCNEMHEINILYLVSTPTVENKIEPGKHHEDLGSYYHIFMQNATNKE